MPKDVHLQYQPACRPSNVAQCGMCNLAYDCNRLSNGRKLAWPLLALAALAMLMLVLVII